MESKLYLYGVVKPNTPDIPQGSTSFNLEGIPTELHLTFFDGLGIVYSEKEMEEGEEVRPSRKNLIGHQKVIEGLMTEYQVLPFSFGMLVDTMSDLEKLMTEQRDELQAKLEKIEGKIELSLKIVWENMEQVFAELVEEKSIIHQKREELFSSDHPDQNAKIELGKLVEEKLENKKTDIQIRVINKLFEKAVDHKILKNISEEMITNIVFLVDKELESQFDVAVNELSEELEGNKKFKYIGPTPPYNFL